MSSTPWRLALVALTCAAILAGCSGTDATGTDGDRSPTTERIAPDDAAEPSGEAGGTGAEDDLESVTPGVEWVTAEPEDMGFDRDALERIARAAEEGGSNCLLITRAGRLVAEWYWNVGEPERPQEVFSATKSFTSTLVGIAQDRGALRVEDPAATYLDEWASGPSAAVTVEDLLSNDSGRSWSLTQDYVELIRAPDRNEFALSLAQQHPPGEVWAYNNAAIQALDVVLERATGQRTSEFASEHLLQRIGMGDSEMTVDPAGNTLTFMGLQSTCRDMARFGHLFLQEGSWDEEQVVSREWVQRATQPSQELSAAYGYLWWLNRPGRLVDPTIATGGPGAAGGVEEGQLVEGAPEDMYWARGLGGQMVQVDPGSQTVAVRLGPNAVPEGAEPFTDDALAGVVTEALVDR
jgi:CubicO group peptidase (beta-lactamase class C family)